MMNFPALDGISYQLEDYETFIESCENEVGWELEVLGVSSDETKNLYGMKLGDFRKPTIFVLSSVHGNEWQAAYISQEFRKYLIDPPSEFKHIFRELTDVFSFYMIPVGNPHGFQAQKDYDAPLDGTMNWVGRTNKNNVDINRDYNNLSQPETNIIVNKIKELKPVSIIDSHGIGGVRYIGVTRNDYDLLTEEIMKSIKFSIGGNIVWYDSPNPGTIRDWATHLKSKYGYDALTHLMEVPGSLETEITSYYGLNAMLHIIAYVKEWLETGEQNPLEFNVK